MCRRDRMQPTRPSSIRARPWAHSAAVSRGAWVLEALAEAAQRELVDLGREQLVGTHRPAHVAAVRVDQAAPAGGEVAGRRRLLLGGLADPDARERVAALEQGLDHRDGQRPARDALGRGRPLLDQLQQRQVLGDRRRHVRGGDPVGVQQRRNAGLEMQCHVARIEVDRVDVAMFGPRRGGRQVDHRAQRPAERHVVVVVHADRSNAERRSASSMPRRAPAPNRPPAVRSARRASCTRRAGRCARRRRACAARSIHRCLARWPLGCTNALAGIAMRSSSARSSGCLRILTASSSRVRWTTPCIPRPRSSTGTIARPALSTSDDGEPLMPPASRTRTATVRSSPVRSRRSGWLSNMSANA